MSLKRFVFPAASILVLLGVFLAGRWMGPVTSRGQPHSSEGTAVDDRESVADAATGKPPSSVNDRMRTSASSASRNESHESSPVENYLRSVPYSVLKQVYYERQDAEFDKMNERYSVGKTLDEEAQARRAEGFLESFRQNNGGDSDYFAEIEWKMRGGKTMPVRIFAKFYSTRPVSSSESTIRPASEARTGADLCWTVSLYVRVSEKYAMDGTSTCVPWTPIRGSALFAVVQPNSKSLVPLFDAVSVPLPGFGTDSAAQAEWYDSVRGQWSGLSAPRWEAKERGEIARLEKEMQAETDW